MMPMDFSLGLKLSNQLLEEEAAPLRIRTANYPTPLFAPENDVQTIHMLAAVLY